MDKPNFMAGNECLDFVSTVEAIVKRSCIIDFGIVQNVPAEGVVDVAVAVSDTEQNMYCMTCVLANIASSSLTVKVKPNVGDRVLVVYPRLYDDSMFTVSSKEDDNKKLIVNPQAKGYNLCSGIAILINQYKKNGHHNYIKIEDGKIEAKLAYDKDNDKNLISLTTKNDGSIAMNVNGNTIAINKDGALTADLAYDEDNEKAKLSVITDKDGAYSITNEKSSLSVDKDGYLSYKNTDDNKTQLTFTSSGMTLQDKNGAKIVTGSDFTTINNKLKVKV